MGSEMCIRDRWWWVGLIGFGTISAWLAVYGDSAGATALVWVLGGLAAGITLLGLRFEEKQESGPIRGMADSSQVGDGGDPPPEGSSNWFTGLFDGSGGGGDGGGGDGG